MQIPAPFPKNLSLEYIPIPVQQRPFYGVGLGLQRSTVAGVPLLEDQVILKPGGYESVRLLGAALGRVLVDLAPFAQVHEPIPKPEVPHVAGVCAHHAEGDNARHGCAVAGEEVADLPFCKVGSLIDQEQVELL